MDIQEGVNLASKTTMRIGGEAKFFAELYTKEGTERAWKFANEQSVPLIVLGGGSNTIFDNKTINALVVRMKATNVQVDGNTVTVETGKILAMLLNELAEHDLDLSPLTGIPGTMGGALFGNAGQGAGGIWLDSFVQNVTVFDGEWKTLSRDECNFRYRESGFKDSNTPPIIWSATLEVPTKPKEEVLAEIERLIQKRIETQPHLKTAGSCFKSLPDGTPAWKLIQEAGLRGHTQGGIQVSEKHCNFLLNIGDATFDDALNVTRTIRKQVPQIANIEMRFYGEDGKLVS